VFHPGFPRMVLATIVAWISVSMAWAGDPDALPDFSIHQWQAEDGLPQNSISSVLQARDGYLWVGTYSGLARFDGVRFTVFDDTTVPEMRSSRVTSLFEDPVGVLWIGHETGELTRYADGQFQSIPVNATWQNRRIMGLATDEVGDLWLLNEEGILVRPGDGRTVVPRVGTADKLVSLDRDPQGRIWLARDGALSVFERGRVRDPALEGIKAENYVQGLCSGSSNTLWLVHDGRLGHWRDGRLVRDFGEVAWGSKRVTALRETRTGWLLAGTQDEGLFVVRPGEEVRRFYRGNGFPSDWIRGVCEDHEGNLWVATGGNGLVVLRPSHLKTLNPPDDWQGRAVLTVQEARDGAIWAGTEGAGLYRFSDESWVHHGAEDGLENPFVWSVTEGPKGRVWAATWGGGVFLQEGGRFGRVPGMEEFRTPVPAVMHAKDGTVWMGSGSGLLQYDSGRVRRFGATEGLVSPDVRSLAEGPDGAIWFGMLGGGLGWTKDGQVRQFGKKDGLPSEFIRGLRFDEKGALWICTAGGGLSRFYKGAFKTIGPEQGLPRNSLSDIQDDGRGRFWISAQGGIIRVSKDELDRCADGTLARVDAVLDGVEDGLPTVECSGGMQPASARTADGRLLFPTSKGLVVVDPARVRANPLPPPVAIEVMNVDGRPVVLRGRDVRSRRIEPGQAQFEFQYTGLSFVSPAKVRFRYRLEGLEPEWMDAGTKRSVNYSYIAPGNYVFRVTACNNDGVWNKTGAALAFTVLPYFWQTLPFRIAVASAAMAIVAIVVWAGTQRKMRRTMEAAERQRAVERERARIAKDIHDDLGASLTRISLLSESVSPEHHGWPQAMDALGQIFRTSRELVQAMDEIVWAVNPKHDTLDSLANYMASYAQDFLDAADIRCRLDLPVDLPGWQVTAEARHNLFLSFKEALNNAVKHSGATQVSIGLRTLGHGFAITITDDGKGFTPGEVVPTKGRASSGNGLANMRQRLKEIGGRCEVESKGRGTTIRLVLGE
jgi:signal transduction histidine kinase/ligand-binding sensor domain-containing protein